MRGARRRRSGAVKDGDGRRFEPRPGDRVEVEWATGIAYPGVIQRRTAPRAWKFAVAYDDGDRTVEDLNDTRWRFIPAGAWVDPGDLAEEARQRSDRDFGPKRKRSPALDLDTCSAQFHPAKRR